MSLHTMLESLSSSARAFSEKTRRSRETMQATSALEQSVFAERYTLESALRLARSDIEQEENMRRPEFRRAYEQISAAMRELPPDVPSKLEEHPVPDFDRISNHDDPATNAVIREKVDSVRKSRADFLKDLREQVLIDTATHRYFIKRVEAFSAQRYLPALALPPL